MPRPKKDKWISNSQLTLLIEIYLKLATKLFYGNTNLSEIMLGILE